MATAVYSKRKGADPIPDGAVYVGRPTVWGNPYDVAEFACGDVRKAHRAAVDAYAYWFTRAGQIDLVNRARRELAGKNLVCWCQSPSDADPLPCHATVLLEIANS